MHCNSDSILILLLIFAFTRILYTADSKQYYALLQVFFNRYRARRTQSVIFAQPYYVDVLHLFGCKISKEMQGGGDLVDTCRLLDAWITGSNPVRLQKFSLASIPQHVGGSVSKQMSQPSCRRVRSLHLFVVNFIRRSILLLLLLLRRTQC